MMTNNDVTLDILHVNIKTKDKNLFTGIVSTVTSRNERGIFDVLPFHANFITLISEYIILNRGLATEEKFEIDKGILYVLSNKVDIYVGI